MKRNCRKNSCKSPHYYKDGFYFRANDSRKIQRFKCKACGTKFSANTGTLEFGQKKRRVNPLLLKLFCAKVTQKRAARIAGQGELKQTKHDPIFTIDHTIAMMRDSISTFVRRSWCVSQDPKRLQGHLDIFIYYYNQFYLGGISPP